MLRDSPKKRKEDRFIQIEFRWFKCLALLRMRFYCFPFFCLSVIHSILFGHRCFTRNVPPRTLAVDHKFLEHVWYSGFAFCLSFFRRFRCYAKVKWETEIVECHVWSMVSVPSRKKYIMTIVTALLSKLQAKICYEWNMNVRMMECVWVLSVEYWVYHGMDNNSRMRIPKKKK